MRMSNLKNVAVVATVLGTLAAFPAHAGKTLDAINADAGVVGITPHKLRHTFASVAEELVSGYALKRMLNHTESSDVTGSNYVGKSENQLRVAWQTVADFIVSA